MVVWPKAQLTVRSSITKIKKGVILSSHFIIKCKRIYLYKILYPFPSSFFGSCRSLTTVFILLFYFKKWVPFPVFIQPRCNRRFVLPLFLNTLLTPAGPGSSVGKTKDAPMGIHDWLRHFEVGNIWRASFEPMAVSSPQITVLLLRQHKKRSINLEFFFLEFNFFNYLISTCCSILNCER